MLVFMVIYYRMPHRGRQAASATGGTVSDLTGIMVVNLIIWVGLFAYVYLVDRKLRRLEDS